MSDAHAAPPAPGDTEALLRRAHELVGTAKALPLSSSVKLDSRDEVLDCLEDAIEGLPQELRAARWLLKEREDFLAKAKREGDEILSAARAQAESMVQRQEVVKAAESRAAKIRDAAQDEARRLRHETEDYCDQRLANFEIVLDRLLRTVQAGRERLQGVTVEPLPPPDESQRRDLFDQDT